jgi:hypothetical protein
MLGREIHLWAPALHYPLGHDFQNAVRLSEQVFDMWASESVVDVAPHLACLEQSTVLETGEVTAGIAEA